MSARFGSLKASKGSDEELQAEEGLRLLIEESWDDYRKQHKMQRTPLVLVCDMQRTTDVSNGKSYRIFAIVGICPFDHDLASEIAKSIAQSDEQAEKL